MVRIAFDVVNCFAAEDFAGNPICVIRDPVDERLMQRIARQMACTLTIFPVRTGARSYDLRMFTVSREVPFGGSASLAAAWAMGEGRWRQSTPGGESDTEYAGGKAWSWQPEPELAPLEDEEVAAAIGLRTVDGLFVGRASGNTHVLAVTRDDPADFTPNREHLLRIARRHGGATVGAVQPVHAGESHARIFTPAHGLPEDPAVGGGAPTVARVLRDHFGGADVSVIRQGEMIGRPSRLEVMLGAGDPKVGGGVRKAAEGALLLG